jgi:hypothetical protein
MGRHDDDEQSDHERKAEVYDRFAEYVRDKMRTRDNPNISVREFDLMGRSGVTHMDLRLENVDRGNKKLYTLVEQFDDSAFLDTREDFQTGNLIYVAHISFKGEETKRHHHHSQSHRHGGGPPSTNVLMFYVFLYMLLLLVAVWKTEWSEWRYIMGK